MTEQSFSIIAYLVAAIFFILALKGLSSPTSARQGNLFGMIGMTIAVITTLIIGENLIALLILVPIALGGAIGFVAAKKSSNDQNARVSRSNALICWFGCRAHCSGRRFKSN